MAPQPSATPAGGRKTPAKAPAVPSVTAARVTRLRAAKDAGSSVNPPALPTRKPNGILAKGKEGLRKVSDKIKEKENKQKEVKSTPSTDHLESLQAFLRIRPPPENSSSQSKPYLEPQGEREVVMKAPLDPSRPHVAAKPPLVYSFNHVFPPATSQSSFFTQTTLPLVEKLLQGENGLMFAYGVSNSGKSYTISGSSESDKDERGVLPRSIDVVFNSIKGLESKASLRCTGLADVELVKDESQPSLFDQLPAGSEAMTDEAVKVDRNHSYAVFVSYSEVYNEKIFDLLDAVLPAAPTAPPTPSRPRVGAPQTRSSAAWGLTGHINSSMNLAALANGGAGVIRRRALALKNDPEGSGKYIAGLNEIRVRTREEALAVFRAGQRARQVFGTLANRESSRSHGIFTIKTVRIHNGAPEDPDSAQVSRLAIVDLAGSERTRNTGTTGDRLKEAGNINKSLMVLGQCLEVLRANQQKIAAPAVSGTNKKLAVVPFRHSKLTEIFQNFFVGDGRAVMIVNVNPYDTGFDENSHVMRFSAIAREVQTTAANKVAFTPGGLRRQISTQFSALKQAVSAPMKIKVVVPVLPKVDERKEQTGAAKSVPSRSAAASALPNDRDSYVMVEEELEVVEEDAEDDSEEERDALVDHLFEQLRELKERLYETEMRNATIEVEVREEVAKEMQESIQRMHADFNKRLQEQVDAGELKTDRKIDILSRSMTPARPRQPLREGMTYLEGTPDIDLDSSFDGTDDRSFESAREESFIEGSVSPMVRPRVSDPFVVHEGEVDSSSENDEEVSDAETESAADQSRMVDEEGDVSRATFASENSEDVLALDEEAAADKSIAVSEQSENVDDDADEDEDDDEVDQDEDVDDDELTEEETETETEEEEEEESDSDFEEEADVSMSTASPSPPRRQSTKPRQSVASARATPAKKTPARVSRIVAISPSPSPSPLIERLRQDSVQPASSDDEIQPVSAKKKRVLGKKKIVMEDDMEQVRVLGAEIKRMVKT